MANLNPVQMLLWIVGLEMISIPLVIFMFNAVFIGYFKAKEQHSGRVANSLSKAFEKIGNDILGKIDIKATNKEVQTNDSEAHS